jgi:hypothetical protein
MKALATFFVTALLLTGSAWAQSSSGTTPPPCGTVSATITAKTSTGTGGSADELVIWVVSGGEARFQISNKPSTVGTGAAGEASVREGILKGYASTCSTGTLIKVIVDTSVLTYQVTGTNSNPTLTLQSVQAWTGTVQ